MGTERSTSAHQQPQNKYQDTAPWIKLVYFPMKFIWLSKFRRIAEQSEDWAYDILYHASHMSHLLLQMYISSNDHFAFFCNKTITKDQVWLTNTTETTFQEYQAFQTTLLPKQHTIDNIKDLSLTDVIFLSTSSNLICLETNSVPLSSARKSISLLGTVNNLSTSSPRERTADTDILPPNKHLQGLLSEVKM